MKAWDAKERVLVRPTTGVVEAGDEAVDPQETAALPKMERQVAAVSIYDRNAKGKRWLHNRVIDKSHHRMLEASQEKEG